MLIDYFTVAPTAERLTNIATQMPSALGETDGILDSRPSFLHSINLQHDGDFMGNRLSKIYTRTGDDGTTGLGDGSRVEKDSLRVESYGTVDEANSAIGVVLACQSVPEAIQQRLTEVQHDLFELGGELCIPGHAAIQDSFILRLENQLDELNSDLPPLKDFILPGGGPATSACHLARTIVRRAERRVSTLQKNEPVRDEVLRYLNRLSDLLFVIARVLARAENGQEVIWNRQRT